MPESVSHPFDLACPVCMSLKREAEAEERVEEAENTRAIVEGTTRTLSGPEVERERQKPHPRRRP